MSNLKALMALPPNRANLKIQGPLETVEQIQSRFLTMGLTAADLDPIDWRGKTTLSPVMNQQSCGDCWAMSSTSALADRFIIQKDMSNLVFDPVLTAQCVQEVMNQGCGGGLPHDAGVFFENTGAFAVSDSCQAWERVCPNQDSCTLPQCGSIYQGCKGGIVYKAKKGSTGNLSATNSDGSVDIQTTIANIKRELLNGPVVACYFVPNDFMVTGAGYKWGPTNGIYINGAYNDDLDATATSDIKTQLKITDKSQWADLVMEGSSPAGHAVSIVGWGRGKAGKYGNVSYWIVRNSWGDKWNEGGFFRFCMNDGTGNNTNCLFDIPGTSIKVPGGKVMGLGSWFGGVTKFDPDVSTGGPRGKNHPLGGWGGGSSSGGSGGSSGKSDHKMLYIILGLIVFLLIVGGVVMLKRRK